MNLQSQVPVRSEQMPEPSSGSQEFGERSDIFSTLERAEIAEAQTLWKTLMSGQSLSPDQADAAALYTTFVFEKVRQI